jgi:hypothetical protein
MGTFRWTPLMKKIEVCISLTFYSFDMNYNQMSKCRDGMLCEKKADCHDIHTCNGVYCFTSGYVPFESKTFPYCIKCSDPIIRCKLCKTTCYTGNELRSKKCAECTNKEKRQVKMERKKEKLKNTLCYWESRCHIYECLYKHQCDMCKIDLPQREKHMFLGVIYCAEHKKSEWFSVFPSLREEEEH